MTPTLAAAVWIALLVVVLGVESLALHSRGAGDTLSEQVWRLRRIRAARALLMGLWGWLTWHFWFVALPFVALTWRDLAALAAGAFLGALLPTPRQESLP